MNVPKTRLTKSARLRLLVLLEGNVAGEVFENANRRLVFRYQDAWQSAADAYPLSISMPLARVEHGHTAIRTWLWGLLPENPATIARLAREHRVNRWSVVSLLEHIGRECAGAVQFVTPGSIEQLQQPAESSDENANPTWLTVDEVELLLRNARMNSDNAGVTRASGQFSLAGAQPKLALFQSTSGKWAMPGAATPTNRILKPSALGLTDFAFNEHACLSLARKLDIPAASSRVEMFGNEQTIVVERYDRTILNGALIRVHQEDCCQALGIDSSNKYEIDGGPGIAQIVGLLTRHSTSADSDRHTLVSAFALNWLIAGTDAHSKNYSIMLARGPQIRLAPLYDIISAIPYPNAMSAGNRMAMAIGGEYSVHAIGAREWERIANTIGEPADAVLETARRLSVTIPEAMQEVVAEQPRNSHARRAIASLQKLVAAHCKRCAARL